jgi:arylsulfatase A-like enzyme/Tfp pilus assembly protein PilF
VRTRARILVGAGVIVTIAGVGALVWQKRDAAAPPNVLLVSIDTLRADRLGSYGYARAATPVLDRLAAEGVRFADAITVAPLTLPAHTSLLTGTFPMAHGVRDNGGFYVADEAVTLAETLRARGYRTGGFVGAFVLDRRWGIAQGFDTWFDEFDLSRTDLPGMDAIQRRAADVVDRATAWLGERADAPFFAFVHLYDPHTPYEAPEPYRSRFPRDLAGAYDAEIAYTDAQVGRLLDVLSRNGRLERTVVVIVGDHGEALGDHGEATHGFFIYEPSLHVPLIVRAPGQAPRVVDEPVRLVDVMPTVLDLAGIARPPAIQGTSLVPAMRGERVELLTFSETWYPRHHYNWSELRAVRDGRYKFILAPRRELYDLQSDPRETVNLVTTQASTAAALERALADLVGRSVRASGDAPPRRLDPEAEERLRALGYVGGTVSGRVLEDGERGDPKDKLPLYILLRQAGEDSTKGHLEEAIDKVERALAADADIVEGHVMLGNLHVKLGRHEHAMAAYRRALAIDDEHLGATVSLAMVYKSLERLDDAAAGFDRALALDARDGKSLFHLADIRMRRGNLSEAERLLTRALGAGTDRPPVLLKLGECYIEMKRWDEGERAVREALAARGTLPNAHYDLGLIHEARGEVAQAVTAYEAELAAFPGHHTASFNLGKLLAASGRPAEALARFRAAVEVSPAFGTGHLYLAKSLLDAGDLAGAERAARTGLASNPDARIAPLGHFVLADVYSRLGRKQDAARELALAKRKGAP